MRRHCRRERSIHLWHTTCLEARDAVEARDPIAPGMEAAELPHGSPLSGWSRGMVIGRPSRRAGVQLAPGFRLAERLPNDYVLESPTGAVQLNDTAAAILRLCDGSRSSAKIVAELARRSPGGALADDVNEFLQAARERGWIVGNSR